ncbi:RHS repeat-associated core domain-containing protein [Pseudomonas huanghezhanensis]|uniref:RHS repeat-associated core domain-containing protein n=1 Tax=Pseudomonas huanghezhanensis TaxID=3002903 RepID=UPI0022868DF4|nr:RHS repeat-associated core domain-containing protein [Pseudomonas sp. BSw22131]
MTGLSNAVVYRYDALDRLVGRSTVSADITRFYRNNSVVAQQQEGRHDSIVRLDRQLFGVLSQVGEQSSAVLYATDQQSSVRIFRDAAAAPRTQQYTPYGETEGGVQSLLGFNGELPDPVTGCYLLGNGYRAYDPALMRFHSPDSMSPFGAGGINAYAYCLGDPINLIDPTGHFSWQAAMAITLTAASLLLSIATLGLATPLTGPAMYISVSLGVAAIASDVLGIAGTVVEELAPDSDVGAVLGYISIGLAGVNFVGKRAARELLESAVTRTVLARQGAVRIQARARRVSRAIPDIRNNVQAMEQIDGAREMLFYAKMAWKVYDKRDEALAYTQAAIGYVFGGKQDIAAAQPAENQQGLMGGCQSVRHMLSDDDAQQQEAIRRPLLA